MQDFSGANKLKQFIAKKYSSCLRPPRDASVSKPYIISISSSECAITQYYYNLLSL
jgi:hypothetical protein